MKNSVKFISLLLALLMLAGVLSAAPVAVSAAASKSGATGDCTWSFNETSGELTISGSGAMASYSSAKDVPWYSWQDKLKTVTLKSGVTKIGDNSFVYFQELTKLTMPDTVTEIGEKAFWSCKNLADVKFSSKLVKIGSFAFDSNSIKAITIPKTIEHIGAWAFAYSKAITSLTIPDGAKCEIFGYAFEQCESLETVSIGKDVFSVDSYAFPSCPKLKTFKVSDSNAIYCAVDGNLYSKDKTALINYAIGKTATSFTVPKTVKELGNYAFYEAPNLKTVIMQEGLEKIGERSFYICKNLSGVTFPDSLLEVGDMAFLGSKWFNDKPDGIVYTGKVAYKFKGEVPENASIDSGTLGLGDKLFYNAANLKRVALPKSLKRIGRYCFSGCTNLEGITLTGRIESIGQGAFNECSSIKSFTIPNSVTYIGENAFFKCSSLVSIKLSENITRIERWSLAWCPKLTNITIPEKVTSIGWYAFFGSTGLKKLTVPKSVAEMESMAFGYTNVTFDGYYSKIDGVSMEGYSNTEAEKYAKRYSIPFTALDKVTEATTAAPTTQPTTAKSTTKPTTQPTTAKPTTEPTEVTTAKPTAKPTTQPTTAKPTVKPTTQPTTAKPATDPTEISTQPTSDVTVDRPDERAETTAPMTAPNAVKKGDSIENAEKYVKALKNDADPDGSDYAILGAKATKVKKTSITVKWNKVKGAKKYVIFGNRCGKAYKKIKTITKTTYKQTKLKKGKYYKYLIIAVDKNGKVLSTSKTIHAATKGGTVGNAKSVTVTPKSVKLKVKAVKKLKVTVKAESKKLKIKNHRKVKFESTNPKIASVTSKGKIKAKKQGSCYVYAYAQNGVSKKVKVVVKN